MQNYKFTANLGETKIDKAAGVIRGVSLISVGEALGHGVFIDDKTLAGLFAMVSGKTVKCFLKHDMFGDRVLDEVGLFSAFYLEDGKLKGTLTFLKAFREHNAEKYDKIFELSEAAPEHFGLSISFSGHLVTYGADGAELPYNVEADGEKQPFVRVDELFSCDIVGQPAANPTGLFSQPVTIPVEAPATVTVTLAATEPTDTPAVTVLAAPVDTEATQLAATLATLTLENQRLAKEAAELAAVKAELAALRADKATIEAALAERTAAYEQIKGSGGAFIAFGVVPQTVLERYQSLTDPAERLAYYRANKLEIWRLSKEAANA